MLPQCTQLLQHLSGPSMQGCTGGYKGCTFLLMHLSFALETARSPERLQCLRCVRSDADSCGDRPLCAALSLNAGWLSDMECFAQAS